MQSKSYQFTGNFKSFILVLNFVIFQKLTQKQKPIALKRSNSVLLGLKKKFESENKAVPDVPAVKV